MNEPDNSEDVTPQQQQPNGAWWLVLGACVFLPAAIMPMILDENLPGSPWVPLIALPVLSMSGIVMSARRLFREGNAGCWLVLACIVVMVLVAAACFVVGCAARFRM